jgi:hypothetical protein
MTPTETYIHAESASVHSNPSQGSVQLVLDSLLVKPGDYNPISIQAVPMDYIPCDPSGSEGVRAHLVDPGIHDERRAAYAVR